LDLPLLLIGIVQASRKKQKFVAWVMAGTFNRSITSIELPMTKLDN